MPLSKIWTIVDNVLLESKTEGHSVKEHVKKYVSVFLFVRNWNCFYPPETFEESNNIHFQNLSVTQVLILKYFIIF